jgi:hypothetical protein
MMVEIAQQVGAALLAPVMSDHAYRGDGKHNASNRRTQPGLVHVSLLSYTRITAGGSRRHA